MKNAVVTFDELRELLLELGFREKPEKTRLRFEHATIGTTLLFRLYDGTDKVNARDMLVVRGQLEDNGLIDSSAFDRFLQNATA